MSPEPPASEWIVPPPVFSGRVELVESDPTWPAQYDAVAARIRAALGDRAILLEHVGSTSVPGLAAKPLIDVVLGVPDSTNEAAYVADLEAAGFELAIREDEYEHRLFRGTNPMVNLHAYSADCEAIADLLAFRDWLRSHPADRELYEREKRRLGQQRWDTVQDYADAKTDVIGEIVGRALAGDGTDVHGTEDRAGRRSAQEDRRMSIASSTRVERLAAAMAHVQRLVDSPIFGRRGAPGVADFMVGNPQEMPLPDLVEVLHRNLEPRDKNWFAYKLNEPEARIPVARSLSGLTGLDWDPEDVFMTNAGFGALTVTLRAITEPGDEVIYLSPPWFFYELLIAGADAVPVRLNLAPPAFDLDPDAIADAITPRTRAVIVNSPHNPSGRVYPLEALSRLAAVLEEASRRAGRTVHLIADEPYRRILFDGIRYHSAAEAYPGTIITYSYGKVLLSPGQRLGYIAVPPTSPERAALRRSIELFQWATGYAFADALMQHSTADLEHVSIDIPRMQARRDRLVGALRAIGYQTTNPEGTFYVLVRCPIDDDQAFAERLASEDVLVLPGTIVELPGWMRLSLTASDEMVEQALPVFQQAFADAR